MIEFLESDPDSEFDLINSIDRSRIDLSDPIIVVMIIEFMNGQPLARERMTDREQRNLRSFAFGYH